MGKLLVGMATTSKVMKLEKTEALSLAAVATPACLWKA
jgi:hypothetical protein